MLPAQNFHATADDAPPFAASDPSPLPRNGYCRERTAESLIAPSALMQLNLNEAKIFVSHMRSERVPAGEIFITEGDTVNTDFMVLLSDREVLVENITVSRTKPVTVTVLRPGSLIAEVGVLNTGPRSASCSASTGNACAVLTRNAIETLSWARSDCWPSRHVSPNAIGRPRRSRCYLPDWKRPCNRSSTVSCKRRRGVLQRTPSVWQAQGMTHCTPDASLIGPPA